MKEWGDASWQFTAMPRFYFNLHCADLTVDREGQDCSDLDAARTLAIHEVRQIAADDVKGGSLATCHRIDVLDASRKIVASVAFGDAVAVS